MTRHPRASNSTAQQTTHTSATPARYRTGKARSGWYVYDTHTGATWPGLVQAGARQLADRLNRRNP